MLQNYCFLFWQNFSMVIANFRTPVIILLLSKNKIHGKADMKNPQKICRPRSG
jgi:hypothetical protein